MQACMHACIENKAKSQFLHLYILYIAACTPVQPVWLKYLIFNAYSCKFNTLFSMSCHFEAFSELIKENSYIKGTFTFHKYILLLILYIWC